MVQSQETHVNITHFLTLGKDTLFYGATNAAAKVVPLLLLPFYTRFFSPAQYGVIELLLTASALLSRLFSVGVDSAFLRFYNDSTLQDRKKLFSTSLSYLVALGIPAAVALCLFSHKFSRLLFGSDVHSGAVTLMLLTVPFIMAGWIPQDLARLKFEKVKYNFLVVGGTVFYGIAAVILVFVLHLGLLGVMLSHFLRAILFAFLGLILVRQDLVPRIDLGKLKKLLGFGAPLLPAAIALWVSNSSDRFFLLRLASLDSVGVYSVANRLAWIQWFVFSSFQLAFTPIAYSIYKKPGANFVFRKVFIYYIVLSSILGIGISVFGLDLLRVLTPQAYHPAYKVIGLLNLSVILHGVFYILGIGISIAKKTKYFAYSYVSGAAINILLNLLLIPRYDVIGAASATLVSFGMTALLGSYWSNKIYPLHFPLTKLVVVCSLFLTFCLLGLLIDSELGGYILAKVIIVFIFMVLMFLLLGKKDRMIVLGLPKKLMMSGRKRL